jgi:hypothetical protein
LSAGAFHQIARDVELLLRQEFVERGAEDFGTQAARESGAQLFARYSGKKRILFVKAFDAVRDFFEQILKRGGPEK